MVYPLSSPRNELLPFAASSSFAAGFSFAASFWSNSFAVATTRGTGEWKILVGHFGAALGKNFSAVVVIHVDMRVTMWSTLGTSPELCRSWEDCWGGIGYELRDPAHRQSSSDDAADQLGTVYAADQLDDAADQSLKGLVCVEYVVCRELVFDLNGSSLLPTQTK